MKIYDYIYFGLIFILGYLPYKLKQRKKIVHLSWLFAVLLSFWFVLFSVLLLWPLREHISSIHLSGGIVALFIAISMTWFISPAFVRTVGKQPKELIQRYPLRLFVRFDPSLIFVKYFDVLFQQSAFLYILMVLLGNMAMNERIFVFTLFVVFIHLGNCFFLDKAETLFYSVLSIPFGIGFGWLIANGFILLTVSMHLAYYLLFYGRYWVVEKRLKKYENR